MSRCTHREYAAWRAGRRGFDITIEDYARELRQRSGKPPISPDMKPRKPSKVTAAEIDSAASLFDKVLPIPITGLGFPPESIGDSDDPEAEMEAWQKRQRLAYERLRATEIRNLLAMGYSERQIVKVGIGYLKSQYNDLEFFGFLKGKRGYDDREYRGAILRCLDLADESTPADCDTEEEIRAEAMEEAQRTITQGLAKLREREENFRAARAILLGLDSDSGGGK